MLKEILKTSFYRILELFIGSIAMSSTVCLLCNEGIIPEDGTARDIILLILPIACLVYNWFALRRCYFALGGDIIYYTSNFLVTGIFAVVSLIFYYYSRGTAYSWLFLVTGLGSFLNFYIPGIMAITTFHIILFLSILLAPIGLGWIKVAEKENEELLERVPGILEINPLEQKADTEVHPYEKSKTEKTENPLS